MDGIFIHLKWLLIEQVIKIFSLANNIFNKLNYNEF